MGRKRIWPPRPGLNKGRERVWWNGAWHDLGPAGSPEAKAKYGRLISLWSVDPAAADLPTDELLVSDLCRQWLESAAAPAASKQRDLAVRAITLLLEHHLTTPVARFGPVAVSAWQAWLCRQVWDKGPRKGELRFGVATIRKYVRTVRHVWKWAASTERIPFDRYAALLTVPGPRPGEARAEREVPPADLGDARRALAALRPPARAAVELLTITGARPSEILSIRPMDVFRSGVVHLPKAGPLDLDNDPVAKGLWVYVPDSHKTERYGRPRWVQLGRTEQQILAPFLERDPATYCFSPAEAMESLRAEQRAERLARNGGSGGSRKPKRTGDPKRFGESYTSGSLRTAVTRACEKAGVPRFTPYQLRHAVLTEIDLKYGLDAAQHVGGHSSPQTTRRYARRSFAAAAKVVQERGGWERSSPQKTQGNDHEI